MTVSKIHESRQDERVAIEKCISGELINLMKLPFIKVYKVPLFHTEATLLPNDERVGRRRRIVFHRYDRN